MSSAGVSPPIVKPKSLSCPNCGAPVEMRGFAHTLNVVCPNCLSVLDASSPELQILQAFQGKVRVEPKIPLGSRGTLSGVPYQVIGFQTRSVTVDEDVFSWDEYLLFNPYKGFRYLSEYQGHWNFIRPVSALPVTLSTMGKPTVQLLGRTYTAFDAVTAQTSFVLGEFPWQVRMGDSVQVNDYIAPPYMLSAETTEDEITWSLGEYITGAQLWQAFQLKDKPPDAVGTFANQPSPVQGKARSAWHTWLWLNVALAAVAFLFSLFSANRVVFSNEYYFMPGTKTEASFVSPTFELTGHTSNVELAIQTNLSNNWAYFNFALINEDSGQAFDFGREVSYYTEGGETEGKPNDSVIVPRVPSGRYYLRVEPEMDNKRGTDPMRYELSLRRDVPRHLFFWIAALLLLIPPIVTSVRAASFEAARWRESDYAPAASTGGDE
jgi:hypothetical protein